MGLVGGSKVCTNNKSYSKNDCILCKKASMHSVYMCVDCVDLPTSSRTWGIGNMNSRHPHRLPAFSWEDLGGARDVRGSHLSDEEATCTTQDSKGSIWMDDNNRSICIICTNYIKLATITLCAVWKMNFLPSQATFGEDFMRTYWNRRQTETTPRKK